MRRRLVFNLKFLFVGVFCVCGILLFTNIGVAQPLPTDTSTPVNKLITIFNPNEFLTRAHKFTLQPAVGDPLPNLTIGEMNTFRDGQKAFAKQFSQQTGLGPTFNDLSCKGCHSAPALGGSEQSYHNVTRAGYSANEQSFDPLTQLGGSLFHAASTNDQLCPEVVPPQANVIAKRKPSYIFGDGLLELIPDYYINLRAANQPLGLHGRVQPAAILETPGVTRAGRFGAKAQHASVESFCAEAALQELGITNALFPAEHPPQGNVSALANCDAVPDPEDNPSPNTLGFVKLVSTYSRMLAPPPQTPKSGMSGETLFNQIGCNSCHVSSFPIAISNDYRGRSGYVNVKPYSDFLLHYMGALGDGIAQGTAARREMMTAPLWGMALRSSTGLLHDGQPSGHCDEQYGAGLNCAIAAHGHPGSEAATAAAAYFNLSQQSQTLVLQFLSSLGRREFDWEPNNTVDNYDYQALRQCLSAAGPFNVDHPCAIFDIDANGQLTATDVLLMAKVYTGSLYDCNCSGTPDLIKLYNGAADANYDGVPDVCDLQGFTDIQTEDPYGTQGYVRFIGGCNSGDIVDIYVGRKENAHMVGNRCINLDDQFFVGTTICPSWGGAQLNFSLPQGAYWSEIKAQAVNRGPSGTGFKKSFMSSPWHF